MNVNSKEIMEAALLLSEVDRLAVVERLLESLSAPEEAMAEKTWGDELERRLEDFRLSPETAIPWEHLKDQE